MKRHSGFSIFELVIGMAIVAIVMGLAVPAMRDTVLNARLNATANDFLAMVALANSTAMQATDFTVVCSTDSANPPSGFTCTTGGNSIAVFTTVNDDGDYDPASGDVLIRYIPNYKNDGIMVRHRWLPATLGRFGAITRAPGLDYTQWGPVWGMVCDQRGTERARLMWYSTVGLSHHTSYRNSALWDQGHSAMNPCLALWSVG